MWNQEMPEIDVLTLGRRLKDFREKKGRSQRELALRTGIGHKTLQRIEDGRMLLISPHLPKIAAKLNMLLSDPLAGNFLEPSLIRGKPIPVWEQGQAGNWVGVSPSLREAETKGWIVPQDQYGPDIFAMIWHSDSMLPTFKEGDVVVADPDRKPRSGCFVIAKKGDEPATLKAYAGRGHTDGGEEKFKLRPLNDLYETLYSDRDKIVILGVVVEKTTKFL